MARPWATAAALAAVLLAGIGCGGGRAAGPAGTGPAGTGPAGTEPSGMGPSGPAAAKLAPSLAQRLPRLPADQPVRLIATLAPGVRTGPFRERVERLGGQLVQRFTLIEAAVVTVPRTGVLPLAQLPEVRLLELADSGEPPPR